MKACVVIAAFVFILFVYANTTRTVASENSSLPILMDSELRTCKKWLENRNKHNAAERENSAFLHGFFSGYNAFNQPKSTSFLSQDAKNIFNALDTYCSKEPDSHIAVVAIKFIKDLHKNPQ